MKSNLVTNETVAFISIGSNQNNPIEQVIAAVSNIELNENITLLKKSSLYLTKPYGYLNQDDFINAVVQIKTSLNHLELFKTLQNIEVKQNRIKTVVWGPRSIDLDILVFGNLTIKTSTLNIPHHDLENRNFVVIPWHEIDPNWILPNNKKISDLLINLKKTNKTNGINLLNMAY